MGGGTSHRESAASRPQGLAPPIEEDPTDALQSEVLGAQRCRSVALSSSVISVVLLFYALEEEPYYEARNDYTNNSETILLCNRCACNWKINSQTIHMCNWRAHRKYLVKAPNYTKEFLPETPCVTDVLCNWEINSQIINMCV